MSYIDDYINIVKKYKENNDLFIIKSYIYNNKNICKSIKYNKVNVNEDIDYFTSNSINIFNRNICNHRYTYICEIIDFYDLYGNYCEYCLKIKIVKVIDNPMNIPEIFENNILILKNSSSNLLYPANIIHSYSMIYSNIDNNIIECKNIEAFNFNHKKYFYLEIEKYDEQI